MHLKYFYAFHNKHKLFNKRIILGVAYLIASTLKYKDKEIHVPSYVMHYFNQQVSVHMDNVKNTLCTGAFTTEVHLYLLPWRWRPCMCLFKALTTYTREDSAFLYGLAKPVSSKDVRKVQPEQAYSKLKHTNTTRCWAH